MPSTTASTEKSNESFVLVTGGAGYIGSHTVLELLKRNIPCVVIDNLSNSSEESLHRVERLTGKKVPFHRIDLLDQPALDALFQRYRFNAVIHFAGLKAVGESVQKPLAYYHNNITGTLYLAEVMKKHGARNIVFSSSATVYGEPERLPLAEDCRIGSTNPYGRTKQFIEDILRDLWVSDNRWNVILLRYFNPVGAHPSGLIGEDPQGPPNNLMPYVSQVAIGRRPFLSVFGNDYPTKDGTGVRDYIHVVDLAIGHIQAFYKLNEKPGCVAYNLGTGVGYSVLEMVQAMRRSSSREIPYKIVDRRPGDVAEVFADPSLASKELNWQATLGLQEMCDDLWRWQSMNPQGFASGKSTDGAAAKVKTVVTNVTSTEILRSVEMEV